MKKIQRLSLINWALTVFLIFLFFKTAALKKEALTAIFTVILFVLTSTARFFPLSLIYILCGYLFSPGKALVIAIFGFFINRALSYAEGYYQGENIIPQIESRYKSILLLPSMEDKSPLFVCFASGAEIFLPSNIINIFFGAKKVNFRHYIVGSFCGSSVNLLSAVLLGIFLHFPLCDELKVMIILRVFVYAYSYYFFKKTTAIGKDKHI